MDTIANRIKKAMELRGIKQSELVEKTNIGKSSISTYLSGAYEPKQRNIYKIAKALDVSESWLIGNDVPMERNSISIIKSNGEKCLFDIEKISEAVNKAFFEVSYENEQKNLLAKLEKYIDILNNDGLIEAEKRIEELTYIPKYCKEAPDYLQPVAAHERTDIETTEEGKKHDDDIMNDDSIWDD